MQHFFEVGRMRPGQPVSFRVDAYPTDTFHGNVSQVRLQPATVQNVVTYSTVIDVPNPQYKLKPGMTANVTIEIARRSNVLRAPAAALRFRPTNDIFAALKQEVPADLNRAMGRGPGGPGGGGGRGGGFNGASGQPPAGEPAPAPGNSWRGHSRGRRGGQTQSAVPNQGNGGAPTRSAQGGGDRSGERPSGDSARGGGRGGAYRPPEQREERRQQMEERLKNMSPEERERWQARMRDGGGRGGAQGSNAPGNSRGGHRAAQADGQSRSQRSTAGASGIALTNATTIDALFAPLAPTEGRGRLWAGTPAKQLKAVNVRTGISDGTWTEILGGGEASELQGGRKWSRML